MLPAQTSFATDHGAIVQDRFACQSEQRFGVFLSRLGDDIGRQGRW